MILTQARNRAIAGQHDAAEQQPWRCVGCGKAVRKGDPCPCTEAPRTTSCGCCTAGCVCANHQNVPAGQSVTVCTFHADPAHPHPHVTSPL